MEEKREELTRKLNIRSVWLLVRDSGIAWGRDDIAQQGAALSFFTIFSLSPLLILITVFSSFGFGYDAARGHIVSEVRGLIGTEGAKFLQTLIKDAYRSDANVLATIFSFVMLMSGASAVFVQLRDSLNRIWHVEQKPSGTIHAFLRARLLAFAIILGFGFLLLVSLIISSLLAAMSGFLSDMLHLIPVLLTLVDFVFSFVGITIMFGLMFKYVSDAVLRPKDLWIGAAVTSFLFSIGKQGIGLYLGNGAIGSTFGTESTLVIMMLWAFYSSQIVLLGAEFTYLYATRFGTKIVPKARAINAPNCEEPTDTVESKRRKA